MIAMYASNAIMPHVTSPEYNSRLIYQGNQLQTGSSASVGNFHDSSMNYFNYQNMQSYPGEFQSSSVQLSVGSQRSNAMDDRSSSNYPNLSTSRNPFANSVTNNHEYFALEDMDNREPFACQQSISQGQPNVRRISRSPFDSGRKSRSWTDAVFASMDREAESILELVNEDAMELERIAATIKQDCKSPNSATDTLLGNDYASLSLPSIGPVNDLSFSRWNRPQYGDVHRRKRSPRSETRYLPDDFALSSGFQTFSLDSPPGQDFRYGDLYGLPNTVGHFASNPNLGEYVRNGFPHQHSFLNDLQTYHGASAYPSYRQNFALNNMRPGSEVMLGETSRSYYKPCSKDRVDRGRASRHGEVHDGVKRFGEASKTVTKAKTKGESRSKMCLSDEYKGILGKRKSDHTDDEPMQHKKPKFYFEREEHYVVHKLLRELSSSIAPSELPRTTSASLFYRLLSSKAEPRIMQTVGGASTSGKSRKIVVRDDVSEDEIGKYSHVGSHPFIYIQGAASRASPTKSSKLIELLTTKSPVAKDDVNKENKENTEKAVNREEKPCGGENGDSGQQVCDESTSDPIR